MIETLSFSNVHFIDKEGTETYMDIHNYPPQMEKKMKLLSYFKRYMTEHLVKAGAAAVNVESDQLSRIPHLHTWFRTMCAVVMHLTNGTVQVQRPVHFPKRGSHSNTHSLPPSSTSPTTRRSSCVR